MKIEDTIDEEFEQFILDKIHYFDDDIASVINISKEKSIEISERGRKNVMELYNEQEQLPPEMEKVLYDNLWDLYIRGSEGGTL